MISGNEEMTDILQYIPQRPPFVMIDDVLSADETTTQTEFLVREGHLFVQKGYFTTPGLVENMAQTAAAGSGYRAVNEHKQPATGFIGALKNLKVYELPKTGDRIKTSVSVLHQVMNASIVQGNVYIDEKVVASCEFKIFLQSEA